MKKISIKLKIENSVKVLANMHMGGKEFSKEYSQFDRIFVPKNYRDYDDFNKIPQLIIRTNTIDNKISNIMIMKRIVNKDVIYYYQTQIMDYNQTAHIINNMGYELYAEVPKKRRKMVSGSITAYLDEVDGYGWFFKIEKTLKDDEPENTDELWDILTSLELKHAERAPRYSETIKGANR